MHDVSVLHSSLGLNHPPSCVYAASCSSIHALGDTWDVSLFCGVYTVLHLAFVCTHLSVRFSLRRPGTLGSHCRSVFHFLRNHQTFSTSAALTLPPAKRRVLLSPSTSSLPLLFWILAPSRPPEWEVASPRGSDSHRPDGRIVSRVY